MSGKLIGGAFHGAGEVFADDRAHGAADERILHGADDDRFAFELAAGVDDGVVEAGVLLRALQPRSVRLQVGELQRVDRDQVVVFDFVLTVVQQVRLAGTRIDAEVAVALGADVKVLVEIFLPDDLAALVALHPEAFGLDLFLARSVEVYGFSLKPCHG